MTTHALDGLRILVVEDEPMISAMVGEMLTGLGCHVVGPAASISRGVALAETEALGGALLDVNIRGDSVYPVADALTARGIPFAFVTGYRSTDLAPPYDGAVTLEKPFDEAMLVNAVSAAVSQNRE